jgi:hypothetical protein
LLAVKREGEAKAKGKTKLDRIASQLVQEAIDGDVPAAKEIADRLDGKVPQALVGGDDGDKPIRHIHEVRHTIVDPRSSGG